MDFRWIHLSDFHFTNTDPYERNLILRALVAEIQRCRDQDFQADALFATGDVGNFGKLDEYTPATEFFDAVLQAASLEKSRLFVVPGNHDLDKEAGSGLARSLNDEQESVSYFSPEKPKYHFQKFQAFQKWFNSYFNEIRTFPANSTCYEPEILLIGGRRIAVLALNTALFSLPDEKDHNRLWIGRRNFDVALNKLKSLKGDLTIALMHHPLDWLHDAERSNIKAELQAQADFVLRGHLHENEIAAIVDAQGGCLHLAAGACYQTRKYPNTALFCTVDFGKKELNVKPIRYSDNPKPVWTQDTSLFLPPKYNDHIGRFPLSIINNIIEQAHKKIDLPFGDSEIFFNNLDNLDAPQQFLAIVKAAIHVCKLSAMIFIATTFRHYEQRIIDESKADTKKVGPMKQIIALSFGQPGLITLHKLARYCYHLIDEHSPSVVCTLRSAMAANPILGPVGDLLDDLEKVFPSTNLDSVRIINKSQLRKPILEYLLPELAKYETRITEEFDAITEDFLQCSDVTKWRTALSLLLDYFSPIRSLTFRVREIKRVRNDSDEFDVLMTTYRNGRVLKEGMKQTYEDIFNNRIETYELLFVDEGEEIVLDLFPFIVIRDDRLHYYTRTRARGYEYNAVFGSTRHIEPTKRKFSHVVLEKTLVADLQGLFWTQVMPTVSNSGVRANIPTHHGPIIGRTQQITDIMEQIIEIPNQNGIVHGPGGVGKTALLIELTRNLFEETSSKYVHFKNIIWVSAKPNYYDPLLDRVDAGQPQFQSLDNVLAAILEFHEFEDANTYKQDEKKWLVLELLREAKTLLILDNFESVARTGQEDILTFFGVKAKQVLRDKPDYFKVLVTSRQLIPSGFHQIKLKGLDKRASKKLMQQLYERYARSGKQQLTIQQQDAVYDTTQGIPLIIKHCYGKVYEFSCEIDTVLKKLSTAGTKVVDFSFSEIFDLIKKDNLTLKILLLLELSGNRLMARQIVDILSEDEINITERLAQLVNFQCANMMSTSIDEKYGISDEVRFFTRRMTLEYNTLYMEIKREFMGLALDKRMDYTQNEFDAMVLFNDYISQGHYILAEKFIIDQLKEYKKSFLLNLNYAKYLKEIKGKTQEAIDRLEIILKDGGFDQQVLRLLMNYYTILNIPNYEQAYTYAKELEAISIHDTEIMTELSKFYIAWSTYLKRNVEFDCIKEMVRQQKYKEHADHAIRLLTVINLCTHDWHYSLAQCYLNKWDYELASLHVNKAINGLPNKSNLYASYQWLQREIIQKQQKYSNSRHRE